MVEKAERLMETANPEDREDLVDLVESLRDALDQGDEPATQQAMEQLTDLIYYLET